jgi:hypothetical protein
MNSLRRHDPQNNILGYTVCGIYVDVGDSMVKETVTVQDGVASVDEVACALYRVRRIFYL